MDWPTWQQAWIAALCVGSIALVLAFLPPTPARLAVRAATFELTLMCTLYGVWRIARELPLASDAGAIRRARQVNHIERWLHMPSELSLQHFSLDHPWIGRSLNYYYAIMHVPALLAFMVWLFWRHRDHYGHWRNGLAGLTAFCLFIRFVRVAPPRLLPDLGYIDISTVFGLNIYGPAGTGVSDQLAAMPSIHVGWAAVVSLGIVAASTSRWRWLGLSHVILTMLAVSATGNHWWLDGVVAIALLLVCLWVDSGVRRRVVFPWATVPVGQLVVAPLVVGPSQVPVAVTGTAATPAVTPTATTLHVEPLPAGVRES